MNNNNNVNNDIKIIYHEPVDQSVNGKMGKMKNNGNQAEKMRRFNRYLVIDAGEEDGYRIKGIRSDAPSEIIDEFIQWYRENNRYESGRLRPEWLVRKNCIIPT